jgi:hypothetical protein
MFPSFREHYLPWGNGRNLGNEQQAVATLVVCGSHGRMLTTPVDRQVLVENEGALKHCWQTSFNTLACGYIEVW